MAGNLSFSLNGATPLQPTGAFNLKTPITQSDYMPGATPASKALNTVQYQGISGQQTTTPQYATKAVTPSAVSTPSLGSNQGLITPSIPTPSQPVKSYTVTHPDGTSVSQTYHAPANNELTQATKGLIGYGSAPNPTASAASEKLVNSGENNAAIAKRAQDIATAAGQQISDIGRQGAKGEAGYLTTGTSPVGEGNAAVLAQSTAAQQQAVAQGAAQALEGTAQGLTAQGQTQAGQKAGGDLALAGTGQNITALQNAGSLSQPVSGPGGVLGTPQSVGEFGSGINTTFGGGTALGQLEAGKQAVAMNNANTAAKGIEGTIQQFLQSNPQLNTSTATIGNAVQQWLQGKQLGDPAYQTLFNYLNEYISTLAPILGVGGDTTNLKTEIAQSFVNAKASGQSISQVLTNIGKLADDKYANFVSAAKGGGQVAGGVPVGSTPTSFGTEW